MAKREVAILVASEPLTALDAMFQAQGFVEWSIRSKLGQKTITGRTQDGVIIRHSAYETNGYQERSMTRCDSGRLPRAKRKTEAKRLSKQGLTQSEIAERLGCSQKTVSNDLA